jgi:hypothetical protein
MTTAKSSRVARFQRPRIARKCRASIRQSKFQHPHPASVLGQLDCAFYHSFTQSSLLSISPEGPICGDGWYTAQHHQSFMFPGTRHVLLAWPSQLQEGSRHRCTYFSWTLGLFILRPIRTIAIGKKSSAVDATCSIRKASERGRTGLEALVRGANGVEKHERFTDYATM